MGLDEFPARVYCVTHQHIEGAIRFRRILGRVLLVCALLGIVLPWLPVPKIDRTQIEALPPPMAKLLLERAPAPLPAPVKPQPKLEADGKPAPDKPDVAKPEPKKAPVPEARRPEPNKPPGEVMADARKLHAAVTASMPKRAA